VRAQPVQQFVGGCLQVGSAQRLDLLVHPEEPARPVTGLTSIGSGNRPATHTSSVTGTSERRS
jgi:hypothetical protein